MATTQQQGDGKKTVLDTARIRKLLDRYDRATEVAGGDEDLIETIQSGTQTRLAKELGLRDDEDNGDGDDEDDDEGVAAAARTGSASSDVPLSRRINDAMRAASRRANAKSRVTQQEIEAKRATTPYL
jgi:hypothetical protein